ncbi:metallo-beta-lactamase [Thermosipho melanesiensis]|uniref:Beta-lactamase domain protein n=2 Tax=Thermosipho melanesiensis TaxID=46541 RepID=A6LMA1_THEM4|nr:FprA family A-type flavoprotein [Thermosipho melanesiensis]ABR31052.1 beta-lactamase domain protein [Thermosipho melanesiensis BI429]APT74146.1 metallo-beta-lactamase [Thermosipho melanesiensis]OOC36092.1 metallo-beta-lactamase [Thermosipho melanesiensis]OOC36909.1 metallo-beta-lactamase [Thermosipho melanesiensis]OOC37660.1 metallo-beta-lactamase [Thermosipho melanesiensis]
MVRKISEGVYFVGVIDWDRELFDELIPLPNGTTYNAYIIKGEKVALIDTVDPDKEEEFYRNLKKLNIEKIDYVISNHAEQDHSGLIKEVVEKFGAKVVTNRKCAELLKDHLHIEENDVIEISEGDELDLGGKTLKFYMAPWVHWPETMVTYLKEDKILFSCDFFGSHYATSEIVKEVKDVLNEAKRYYAEIMMPFRKQVMKNIEKVETLEIEKIAPSHGPIYKDPENIIRAYKKWAGDEVEKEVVVLYVSMHGSVKKMIEYVVDGLMNKGIKVKLHNVTKSDIGQIAIDLVEASTVVVGVPMVLAGLHPKIAEVVYLMNALRPKTKYIGIVGSYGWGGRFIEELKGMLKNVKADILGEVVVKGLIKEKEYVKLDELIENISKVN